MNDPRTDVPSPVDLRKMDDAREWAGKAMERRPCREEFFDAISQELGRLNLGAPTVLELGSGPGFLARRVLESSLAVTYVALDFSPSMHLLARERLGVLADRVRFVETDFKNSRWNEGLPMFHAVVSVQAVHELRHKKHAPSLYREIRSLLRRGGIFLMCDHFVGPGGMIDMSLYMNVEEHDRALRAGGFTQVNMLSQKGGLVLFRAAA